jgi:hypothetical protein
MAFIKITLTYYCMGDKVSELFRPLKCTSVRYIFPE